ncbi:MAG: ferredoxin family protein [Phycisphaerae bacterium]|nr:ferredoxin family protein [Phycisphaerae bacterium]
MAGKIVINIERCKGCGLCVAVCPKGGIVISKQSNKSGYFPAEKNNSACTGCASCAIICPEAAIEVYREQDILNKPHKETTPDLVKGKK